MLQVTDELKPQVWQTFSDNAGPVRASDLRIVEEVVAAIHEGAGKHAGSLNQARISALHLGLGVDPNQLYEVLFDLLLVNQTEGLDKDFQEALVTCVAEDIKGGSSIDKKGHPRHLKGVEIDTNTPNSDLRVIAEVENLAPADPLLPERVVSFQIAADNKAHAEALTERIKSLVDRCPPPPYCCPCPCPYCTLTPHLTCPQPTPFSLSCPEPEPRDPRWAPTLFP